MAVTRRAFPRALAAALAAALALAGCSGGAPSEAIGNQPQFSGLDRALADAVGGMTSAAAGGGAPAPGAPRLVILPAAGAAPEPLLSVEIPARGASARLARSGRNGAVVTWRSIDAVSLSLRAPGVLVGTRGLGEDLIVADAAATAAALLRGAPGPATRRHRRLDGDLSLGDARYDCTLTLAGRERIETAAGPRDTLRFEERCQPATDAAGAEGFTNLYWRDASRPVLWQSQQWIGPELGQIRLRHPGD